MDKTTLKVSTIIILLFIIVLGFALRIYNMDFPSIGCHNMKENEYLGIAQEMQKTGDFITQRVYFYNALSGIPGVKPYFQPPLVSYQVLLAWKLFKENIWGPRLCNILFGLLSIGLMYLIAKGLFHTTAPALFSAFLLAIMPLAVFFSRNIQPESPAFFYAFWEYMLCQIYFFSPKKVYSSLGRDFLVSRGVVSI
ncbi:MAG: glycosyltransferase family 39 protein [Candidatus Omnitrophota bacterium]|nr:glycosyltransferase family 39 protein [Candidatus Omnitrophota bacterium]